MELLAVVLILALLLLIAIPFIMRLIESSRRNLFVSEVKKIYNVAKETWVYDSSDDTIERIYSKCSKEECPHQLDLIIRDNMEYFVKLSDSGKVIELYASDGIYQFGYKGKNLRSKEIKDPQVIAGLDEDDIIVITCGDANTAGDTSNVPIPPRSIRLMSQYVRNKDDNYLRTNIKRKDIETVIFTNNISGHTPNGVDCFDVSEASNKSVIAWVTDVDSDGFYEVTIGCDKGVFATYGQMAFAEMINLEEIKGMKHYHTNTTDLFNEMFRNCKKLKSIDLRYMDTTYASTMGSMFKGCTSLTSLDLSRFTTDRVTQMQYMFDDCTNLKSIKFGSGFVTSKVNNMRDMFAGCKNLESVDLSMFDTKNVTSMQNMFYNCRKLETIDLSSFSFGKITSIYRTFYNCTNLKTIYANDTFPTNISNYHLGETFYNCKKLVGGSGTTFKSSRASGVYARIDEGTTKPGYFTKK